MSFGLVLLVVAAVAIIVSIWMTSQTSGADGKANSDKPSVEIHWSPEERGHHGKERKYWWVTVVLTFLAVAGAITTVILSQLSLDEARRATSETEKIAAEAHRQANAAEAQTVIAHEALIANTRPWVKITDFNVVGLNRWRGRGVAPAF